MEACDRAPLGRRMQARRFTVRLIAPQFVAPYVKSNRNDANDAEAICEAMSRPHMRLWGDLLALDERMTELDREIAVIAQNDPLAKRLQ